MAKIKFSFIVECCKNFESFSEVWIFCEHVHTSNLNTANDPCDPGSDI